MECFFLSKESKSVRGEIAKVIAGKSESGKSVRWGVETGNMLEINKIIV